MTAITSSAPTTMIQAPVARPAGYSAGDMILALFKEKIKDVAKATGYLLFWAHKANPSLPPTVASFSIFTSRDVKNFIAVTEMPEKFRACAVSLKNFGASLAAKVSQKDGASWGKVGETARNTFLKEIPGFVNGLSDSMDLGKTYCGITLSKDVSRTLGTASYSSTVISSTNDLATNMGKIYSENKGRGLSNIETTKTPLYVSRAISAISYIALGAIGLCGIFLGAATVAPWMFIACLSVSVTCSIGGFFYEKMYDPECKGLNLKPSVVAENLARQRAFEARTAATTG